MNNVTTMIKRQKVLGVRKYCFEGYFSNEKNDYLSQIESFWRFESPKPPFFI